VCFSVEIMMYMTLLVCFNPSLCAFVLLGLVTFISANYSLLEIVK
jgi:hypothetical protein